MYPKKLGDNAFTGSPNYTISTDGYLRLTFKDLQKVRLVHLISGLDEHTESAHRTGAFFAEITGYTEWVSLDSSPAISIGWDWILPSAKFGKPYYKKVSEPRSNIMLVDECQTDLGETVTTSFIDRIILKINWQVEVNDYLLTRYV